MNSLSLFAAISGIIFLIMDIFNMTISHFFKMENLNLIKTQMPYININNCERANPDENNSQSMEYCARIRFVFLVSMKLDLFSGRKHRIFLTIISSGSRLSASALIAYMVSSQNSDHTTLCLIFFLRKIGDGNSIYRAVLRDELTQKSTSNSVWYTDVLFKPLL